jgi:hypothetical protein
MDKDILAVVNNIREDIEQLNYGMNNSNTFYLDTFTENEDLDKVLMNTEPRYILEKINEVLDLHSAIVSRDQKIKDILRYHMNNRKVTGSVDNIHDATKLVKTILDTYHYKAGGYNFEDCVWNVHTAKSRLFKVSHKSVIFSNSMRDGLLNDTESLKFLINIVKFIKRQLGSNFKINWKKIYDDDREIWWILITVCHEESDETKGQ